LAVHFQRNLESYYGSTGSTQGWYAFAPQITNGWLSVTLILYERDSNNVPRTVRHQWYSDGVHDWVQGLPPTEPPDRSAPPVSNDAPPTPPVGEVINGVLTNRGSKGSDRISVRANDLSPFPQFVVNLNGQEQSFAVQGISSILIDGGDGADKILLDESQGSMSVGARILGGNGSDRITGGSARDTIYAGHGNDTVEGAGGNDAIFGEFGNDSIRGGAGNDHIIGGEGADRLDGGLGTDTIAGESGRDTFFNHKKDDLLDFRSKSDRLA